MATASKTVLGMIGYGVIGAGLARSFACSDDLKARFALQILARNRPGTADDPAVSFAQSLEDIAAQAEVIILAVRPEQVNQTLADLIKCLPNNTPDKIRLLISLATGMPLATLSEAVKGKLAVARIMPNTLLEVNKGIFGLCAEKEISSDHRELIRFLFGRLGTVIEFDESQMNIFTALAGCGPGFIFYILDSFIEAGVSVGLSREEAQSIAIGLLGGCAELASSTGLHPAVLRERGVSPAGMTIAGINHLDRCGVRGHIIDSVKISYERGNVLDREAAPSPKAG